MVWISGCPTHNDTVFAVYAGSQLNTLAPVCCDDDSGAGGNYLSEVVFSARPSLNFLPRTFIIPVVSSAFVWGLIASSSLVLGGLIASWLTLGKRTLGVIMAFGAGVLISAVAYELVFESLQLAKLTGFPTLGFFTGAFTFFVSDWLIGRIGASDCKAIGSSHQSSLVVPLVLAIILDGISESVVIGLGILEGGSVSSRSRGTP